MYLIVEYYVIGYYVGLKYGGLFENPPNFIRSLFLPGDCQQSVSVRSRVNSCKKLFKNVPYLGNIKSSEKFPEQDPFR